MTPIGKPFEFDNSNKERCDIPIMNQHNNQGPHQLSPIRLSRINTKFKNDKDQKYRSSI
jgi:hypothetical protein